MESNRVRIMSGDVFRNYEEAFRIKFQVFQEIVANLGINFESGKIYFEANEISQEELSNMVREVPKQQYYEQFTEDAEVLKILKRLG